VKWKKVNEIEEEKKGEEMHEELVQFIRGVVEDVAKRL